MCFMHISLMFHARGNNNGLAPSNTVEIEKGALAHHFSKNSANENLKEKGIIANVLLR